MTSLADVRTGVVSMAALAVKRRTPCLVTRDKDTESWRHRYRGGVLINDWPRGATWQASRDLTYGLFLDRYTPRDGDIVIELGAGVGTETVFLSELVGDAGRVIACEASPRGAVLLRATLAANSMTNVEVLEAAVMDRAGPVDLMERGGAGNVHNSLFEAGDNHPLEQGSTPVEGLTLDDLVARYNIEDVDLLKVNIEGAENLMVEGMAATLPKLRHAVISCHDFIADKIGVDTFRSRKKVSEFFADNGFRVEFHIDEPGKPWMRDYLYVTAPDR